MKVQVVVTIDGAKETSLVGDAAVFEPVDYTKGDDKGLRDIGFYLTDWKCARQKGTPHEGWCFIPWGSALYISELK